MLRKKSLIQIRIFILALLFMGTSWGRNLVGSIQDVTEIQVIAQYKEKKGEMLFLQGMVEIHYKAKNIKLFADHITMNTETKDVVAEGNVVLQMAEETISAQSLSVNLDSTEGMLQEVYGMMQPSIFYEAETLERKNEGLYQFKKARITSCTQPVPRWNFSSSKANFRKNDYVEMWNAVLRIKKVPVFYFPYMRYPLHKERATGFLIPQLGYNGRKGLTYTQGFYWAIRRNMDATLNLDYYSARGVGGGLEYRYLFPKGTGGQLNLFLFKFKSGVNATGTEVNTNANTTADPSNAYIVRFFHNQALPLNFNLKADVDYQSSFDFLREFDNNFKRALISNRRSQVFLSRAWSSFNFSARISRFETYFKQIDRSLISQSIPEFNFTATRVKLFTPVYLSFNSSFSSWEYGWESAYQAGTQNSSQSFSFRPEISVPFTAIPWLSLESSVSSNLTYYFQSYIPGTKKKVNEPLLQKTYALNFELKGPTINKIFFNKKDEPKLKHIIEPSFAYHYESPMPFADRVITARGYFFRNHYIKYGLSNDFLVKQDLGSRTIFTLGVEQLYYLEPDESPNQIYKIDGETPAFSDINAYVRFPLTAKHNIDFSAYFNPYKKMFSSLRVTTRLGNPTDNAFLHLNWYRSINPYIIANFFSRRHQFGFMGGLKIPKLSLETQAEIDFNIEEKELLYSSLMLIYHYQCLDFKIDFKIFHFREKPEIQYRITFGLGNIGKTTDFLGGGLGF